MLQRGMWGMLLRGMWGILLRGMWGMLQRGMRGMLIRFAFYAIILNLTYVFQKPKLFSCGRSCYICDNKNVVEMFCDIFADSDDYYYYNQESRAIR